MWEMVDGLHASSMTAGNSGNFWEIHIKIVTIFHSRSIFVDHGHRAAFALTL
jgi:hypothetical protein